MIAVDRAGFDVPAGQIVGLIGPNGAGKTTMMDGICGFVRTTGSITIDGHSLGGLPPHRRAKFGIGRTFQGLDLYDDLSVYENVVVGQNVGSLDAAEADRHLEQTLAAAGARRAARSARERPVAGPPPARRRSPARWPARRSCCCSTSRRRASTARRASGSCRRLRKVRDSGVTILLVDHDMNLVLNVCDRIHVLDFGIVIASGTPDEVRADPRVAEAYLGAGHRRDDDRVEVGD